MAKKNLLIIGARGFGREAFDAFNRIHHKSDEIVCKGFLDSKPDALDDFEGYPPILCAPEEYEIQDDDVFFCAMGDVKWRKHYVEMMRQKGAEFISIISPNCEIGQNTKIGEGCFIDSWVRISCDVKIGDYSYLFTNTVVGHDVKLGNYCHLGSFSFMGGYSLLEDGVTLHPGAKVLPHKKVGENSIVGSNSAVIRNVSKDTTVIGVPALKLKI